MIRLSSVRASMRLAGAALLFSILFASHAAAQSQVRVTADQVTIWKPGFTTVATVVNSGTVLDVVARRGEWYEVVVPTSPWQQRETGLISVNRVELVSGTPAPRSEPPRARPSTPAQPRTAAPRQAGARRQPVRQPARLAPLQGFVDFSYGWFAADQSFSAVLGEAHGPWFGGGARYDLGPFLFVEGSVEHFQSTGQRVFVLDDTVYPLGITDKVSITPVIGTGGVRFRTGRYTAYVGGGIGRYFYRETSDFAEDGDNVKQSNTAYRAVGGVQWPLAKGIGLGLEAQYTTVPDALGGGTAAAFDESNLGGFQVKVKLLFSR
jgi:opacity protein-like surface antigen